MYFAYLLFGIFLGAMFSRIYDLYKYVCEQYAETQNSYTETISDTNDTFSKVA